jgi:geranyl-CoA carboxylase alpha subunit
MKRVNVTRGDEKLVGWALRTGSQLWIQFEGETFVIEDSRGTKRSNQQQDESSPDIRAPMPGKVTKVLVAINEDVSKGQVLVMMEAMKMEYSLKSKVDGVVESVGCKAGDQVALQHVLLKIRPTKDGG